MWRGQNNKNHFHNVMCNKYDINFYSQHNNLGETKSLYQSNEININIKKGENNYGNGRKRN